MNKLALKADSETVTFQDPCRLGRHAGVYEPARNLIKEAGADLQEMEHSHADSVCCGVSSWVSCGRCSKAVQLDRLKEAVATGAKKMITPCLKCSIHFNCAQTGELPVDRKEVAIEIVDLTSYLAEAAGLKDKKKSSKEG